MAYKLKTQNELICNATGSGKLFAKKGSMIADSGNFKYSKVLLDTNGKGIAKSFMNHLKRKVTGENLQIMEIVGDGTCYLADNGAHVSIIDLENTGEWTSLSVESENLLAFTENCEYGVTIVGVGIISQKGLFTSKLSYNGENSQVAILTDGNPLVLKSPCRVDADAVVAWTGEAPNVTTDINIKTLLGQTSGESYMFDFTKPGQTVIVQPVERSLINGTSMKGANSNAFGAVSDLISAVS